MEVSTLRDSSMKYSKVNCRGKIECKLPIDTAFLCDAIVMVAMFSNMVNNTP